MESDNQGDTTPAEPAADLDVMPQGRYIPYSGGSMGWFENQGVLRSERNNNYRFHTVMESEHVRSALFQRWGQHTDANSARRAGQENSVGRLMSDESVPESAFRLKTVHGVIEGTTRDIAHYGMRAHFKKKVALARGEHVTVELLHSDGEPALTLAGVVTWIKREVVVWPVWFVGLAFQNLTEDTERYIGEFLERTPKP